MGLQGEHLELYVPKTNKDRNTQFHTLNQTIPLDFEENQKAGSGVGQTGNEIKSEYFKNGSNDFLQIR